MKNEHTPPIVAGSDFALLLTALRDDVRLPEGTSPQEFSEELLEDLTDFDITLQLCSSAGGAAAVSDTDGASGIAMRRISPYHMIVNIPGTATVAMNEGELVVTLVLRHKPTGAVQMAEAKVQRIVKVREVQI